MAYELGQLRDGGLMLMTDHAFPDSVKRVEYYLSQKLFNLVFQGGSEELIQYEVSDFADGLVKRALGNILVVNAQNPQDPEGFDVPLVQVGV
jgi:hypothetical protein